jgi:template-activating factor I
MGSFIVALETAQEAIERLDDECCAEQLMVEQKYLQLKMPVFTKRAEAIAEIPGFWLVVLQAHDALAQLLTAEDLDILQWLVELSVREEKDIKSGYTISLRFDACPHFSNTLLEKKFAFDDAGRLSVTCSKIHFIDSSFATTYPDSFFVTWFDLHDQTGDIGEAIKLDIWRNPVALYSRGLAATSAYEDVARFDDEELEVDGER